GRVRRAASHSRPASSFRCTCVTIVIIGGSPYTSRDALGLTLLPDPPAPAAPAASSGPGLRGLEVDHPARTSWVARRGDRRTATARNTEADSPGRVRPEPKRPDDGLGHDGPPRFMGQ